MAVLRVLAMAAVFASTAVAALSPETAVSAVGERVEIPGYYPAVATGGQSCLAVWSVHRALPNSSEFVLTGRRFAADGTPIDPAPFPIMPKISSASRPQMAYGGGRTMIVTLGAGNERYGTEMYVAVVEENRVIRAGFFGYAASDPRVASNGTSFLLTHGTTAVLLDRDGNPRTTASLASATLALASDGTDFLTISATGTQRVTAGGVAAAAVPLDALATTGVRSMALAWDGSRYVAAWFSGPPGDVLSNPIQVMPLGRDGAPLAAMRTVWNYANSAFRPAQLLWNGNSFVLLGSGYDAWMYRIPATLDGALPVSAPSFGFGLAPVGSSWLTVYSYSGPTAIRAQMLGPDLSEDPRSPSAVVSGFAATRQEAPAIAGDVAQRLVVWRESGSAGTAIHAARIGSDGHPLDDQILGPVAGDASPAVASSGNGYLVAWPAGQSIQVRAVGRDGTLGIAFPLVASASVASPSVTWMGTRFFVAWTAYPSAPDAVPPPSAHVFGIRVAADGRPADFAPIQLSSDSGQQLWPDVAWNGRSLQVVWRQTGCGPTSCDGYGIWVQGVNVSASEVVGPRVEFREAAEERPRVAPLGTGFAVVWMNPIPPPGHGFIRAARLDGSGAPLDVQPLDISDRSPVAVTPAIAWNGSQATIAWVREGGDYPFAYDVLGATLAPDGSVGPQFDIAATGEQELSPALAAGDASVGIVYARYAGEPEYGGAERVFFRSSGPALRTRPVRR